MTYRPRPDDHLVEPIVSALTSAPEAPARPRRRGLLLVGAIVGVVGVGAWVASVLVAG